MQGSRATGHFYTALRLPLAFSMTGYATDPHYAELLIGIIDKYKLDQYDVTKATAAPATTQATAKRLP